MSIWTQAAAFALGIVITFVGIVLIVNLLANKIVNQIKEEFPFIEELQRMQDNDLVEIQVKRKNGKK